MKSNPKDLRVDAEGKLNAQTKYIRDQVFPGMWCGATIRSSKPHAKIKEIKFSDEFDWNKVIVVSAKDIPYNVVAMLEADMPFLAEREGRYVGEPILLIAADDKKLLREAKKNIHIEYEELPAVFDMEESEDSEVKLFGDNNVYKEIYISNGNLSEAVENADKVIEIITETGFQEHLYLEPQGIMAIPEEKKITIKGSMQCPYYIKNAVQKMFKDEYEIVVVQTPTGGAFGGKEDYPSLIAGHAAILAVKSGKPVAIFYEREEDVKSTTKRHPSKIHEKAYVKNDGSLLGLEADIKLDGGAFCTLSQVVLARSALTAPGCYYIPNVRINAKAIATNTVPSGAFRGFGGPQAVFGVEMLMEKIAYELGLPADAVRKRNLIQLGQTTPTGQILKYSVSSSDTLEDVLSRSYYSNKLKDYKVHNKPILKKLREGEFPKHNKDDVLKGIGVTTFLHGAGFTGVGENVIRGKIKVEIKGNGMITVYTAQTEMGQGVETAFRNILSEALYINRNNIELAEIDTSKVPNSGPTVASRTTMVVGSLLIESAEEIIQMLQEKLKSKFHFDFEFKKGYFYGDDEVISLSDALEEIYGKIIEKEYQHPPIIKFDETNWRGDAYPVFSWAAAVAEIEVDPVTFETKVTDYYTTHEIGKAINYHQAEAQIEGGSLQGIGYALYEKIKHNEKGFDITGFTDYIIPTTTEIPNFYINIMENPYPFGPFGAKGLGELPLVGGAPAVLSALWMIFGREFNKIPVTPEDLFSLFEKEQAEREEYEI